VPQAVPALYAAHPLPCVSQVCKPAPPHFVAFAVHWFVQHAALPGEPKHAPFVQADGADGYQQPCPSCVQLARSVPSVQTVPDPEHAVVWQAQLAGVEPPPVQAWCAPHTAGVPQEPSTAHVSAPPSTQRVPPGTHTPWHAPPTQAWLTQGPGVPRCPVESQRCTLLPEHWAVFGVHVPLHWPIEQTEFVHGTGAVHVPSTQSCTPPSAHCVLPAEQTAPPPSPSPASLPVPFPGAPSPDPFPADPPSEPSGRAASGCEPLSDASATVPSAVVPPSSAPLAVLASLSGLTEKSPRIAEHPSTEAVSASIAPTVPPTAPRLRIDEIDERGIIGLPTERYYGSAGKESSACDADSAKSAASCPAVDFALPFAIRDRTMPQDADRKTTHVTDSLRERLYKQRSLVISSDINQALAGEVTMQLLAMANESDDPITLFINSQGGHVESGDTIHDMIRFVRAPVRIVGTGWVASAGALIYVAAEKPNRYCLPNTRFLLHQPSGGMSGQFSDVEIETQQILSMRDRLNRIMARQTGQTVQRIENDTRRNYWLDAQGAKEYGLVGQIIESISELK
jgi:ATP-dependent Clp protease protease subunit